MRKLYVFVMVAVMAAVLAMPGSARSAMWVGGELGANVWLTGTDWKVSGPFGEANFKGVLGSPQVVGGLTIGYDFVNKGFGAYSWPDWMKYFTFATDFTYNRISIPTQTVDIEFNGIKARGPFSINGYAATWSFLFIGHYGFLPDSEVPEGRISPYLGVGPAILFSGFNFDELGSSSSVNIALQSELGVRFMALKNVSIDVGLRYLYGTPTYHFTSSVGETVDINTTTHFFTFLCRAAYHF